LAGAPAEPVAWVIPGRDPEAWLNELCRWRIAHHRLSLYLLPSTSRDRDPSGVFVLVSGSEPPSVTHRSHPYRRLGATLFFPAETELWPPVLEDEVDRVLPGPLYLLHPALGLVGFDEEDRLTVANLLESPSTRAGSWSSAHPGLARAPRLRSVSLADPVDPEAFLEDGRDEIGTEVPDQLPPSPAEGPASAAGRSVNLLLCLLLVVVRFVFRAMAAVFRRVFGEPRGGRDLSGRPVRRTPARGRAGRRRPGSRIGRMRARLEGLTKQLLARRHKEIARLLNRLETDPDDGLRYALPLTGPPHRGVAPPGASLMRRLVDFSLAGLVGGSPVDGWEVHEDYLARLRQKYIEAAEREMGLGRYRRAAYVYAELLGDYHGAANALRTGRHFREAAALYEKHLHAPRDAAECLEEGGLITEAIPIYEGLEEYEKVGELYEQIDNQDAARAAFRREVDKRCARADLVSAARVLEERLHEPDEGLELLAGGWPDHPQAESCLKERFQLLARLGRHESAQGLIRRLRGGAEPPRVVLALARRLSEESRENPDQTTRALAADSVRILCGKSLSLVNAHEASHLIRSLTSTCPEDRLLGRDGYRFLSRK
jgi:tetratricopeptide (TPR) repeat protein